MENMKIYDMARPVPPEAKKPITAGRLKGFTDINPMWRIKRLTEMFGPCGIGWWYEITGKEIREGAGGELMAFVDINLYYIFEGQVSRPIPGTGGSSFVANEKNGLHTSDESYKMALTDAISVAAKAIGVAADVYYDKDRDKYTVPGEPEEDPRAKHKAVTCSVCGKEIKGAKSGDTVLTADDVIKRSTQKFGQPMCVKCSKEWRPGNENRES